MLAYLEKRLLSSWNELFPQQRRPRRLELAVVSSSRESAGVRVVLAFRPQGRSPIAVMKIPRRPESSESLEHEWRLLKWLVSDSGPGLGEMVPRPLCVFAVGAIPVYVQSALPGVNMKALIQRGRRSVRTEQLTSDLWRMERWIRLLQADVPPPVEAGGLQIPRALPLSKRVHSAFPVLRSELRLPQDRLDRILECAEATASPALGERWMHGDLWPGNVLVEGSRWGVIDWDGLAVGHPWEDRLSFALQLGTVCQGRLQGLEDLKPVLVYILFNRCQVTDAVAEYLRTACAQPPNVGGSYRDYLVARLAESAAAMVCGACRGTMFERVAPAAIQSWARRPEALAI